jgi:hypothetical protein
MNLCSHAGDVMQLSYTPLRVEQLVGGVSTLQANIGDLYIMYARATIGSGWGYPDQAS